MSECDASMSKSFYMVNYTLLIHTSKFLNYLITKLRIVHHTDNFHSLCLSI